MKKWAAMVVFLLLPALVCGQSLGEAARREKERRKKNQEQGIKARVVGEKDLGSARDPEAGSAEKEAEGASSGDQASERKDTEASTAVEPPRTSGDELTEGAWRNRVSQARSRLEKAQKRYEFLNGLSLVEGQYYVDENNRPVITSLAQLRGMVDEAKAELETAQKGLQYLLEEARRAAVPPGWLR